MRHNEGNEPIPYNLATVISVEQLYGNRVRYTLHTPNGKIVTGVCPNDGSFYPLSRDIEVV